MLYYIELYYNLEEGMIKLLDMLF